MFINTVTSRNDKSGNVRELNNIDYYKRYIIVEVPEDENILSFSNIIIINISSSTGRGLIGRFTDKERRQNYNIYFAKGKIFTYIPKIITNEISKCVDFNSTICIHDSSYGAHLYDLGKPRLSELMTTSFYNDMYEEEYTIKHDIKSTFPYPKFYNFEHQILNEDLINKRIPSGILGHYDNAFDQDENIVYITLKELIDDHTFIYVSRNSTFNKIDQNLNNFELKSEVPIETVITTIIGPVTNLMTQLMVNELDFCFEIKNDNLRISKMRYKTDHKVPNDLYMNQISNNCITQFEEDMNYVKDIVNADFTVFIKCSLGNIQLRFISYDKRRGYSYRDFNMCVGAVKEKQHEETKKWMYGPIF